MQVRHGLPGIGAAVAHHPVAASQALSLGDLGNHRENMGHHSAVFRRNGIAAIQVRLGNHQDVGGRLGVDIPKGKHQLVFIDLGGGNLPGNDFTEQTIHTNAPFAGNAR